jgi:hypothetical protein
MPLNTTLADITTRLRQSKFPNEQAISQGIVLRVLRELGWETYDASIVWPEYQTAGGGRADVALCHPPSKPRIFIEVKHLGKAEGAVEQALLYAFKSGVPFVVLTDGRTWSFYLPAEPGAYDERRVYMLDLYEQSPDESAEKFRQYLAHESVASGESLRAARTDYHNGRRSQAKAAIPKAWSELVQKRDSSLIEILATVVESKVGFPPDTDDVFEFLRRLAGPEPVVGAFTILSPRPRPAQGSKLTPEQLAKRRSVAAKNAAASRHTTASRQLVIRGEEHQCPTAKDAMATVLRALADSDPSLLERCAQHPAAAGRKRHYIARTPGELYPERPDLHHYHERLPGGWLVATNIGNDLKRKLIDLAVETAGWPREDIVLPF